MLKTEKQNWFSRNLGNIVPVKLIAGLAVGAMLITAIGMPGSGVSADEPARPLGLGYYFELDVADGTGSTITAKVERLGMGPLADIPAANAKVERPGLGHLADIPTSNAKVERQGYGAIDDWAKVERLGFGSLDDVAAPRKAELLGYGSGDDIAAPRKAAIQQATGFDPIDQTFLAAMNERGSSNTRESLRASFGYHGFGPLADWTVETSGSAKATVTGYGHLADIPTVNSKVEWQGFGAIIDMTVPAKLNRSDQGFYSYGMDFVVERAQDTHPVDFP